VAKSRRRWLIWVGIAAGLTVVGGAAVVLALPSEPAYRNPVLRNDAPDPTVIRAEDGFYYAYTTQSYYGARFLNVPILRSSDLIHWKVIGDAFRDGRPAWTTPGTDHGDVWAPHIVRFGSTYYLYFSARNLKTTRMAIGVATSMDPAGPFHDPIGRALILGHGGFDAIDPFVMEANGTKYIYWGSDGDPIHVQELSDDGLSLVGKPKDLLFPSGRSYEGLVEGAWVLRRGRFFYLFYSGDACCGSNAHYAVMVARSTSPTGPFRRDPGNPILAANGRFPAPGHNATIRDEQGRDWIVYHAMIRGDFTNYRYLFLDPIDWAKGWPTVNRGHGPSAASDQAPAT
jgi:arabinan endo-1,5-alpha-L-arabinosidase